MKKILFLFFLFITILGCSVASGPNVSAIYRMPDLKSQLPPLSDKSKPLIQEPLPTPVQVQFQRLYEQEPALALEVGRLPEFQDKIGDRQILALTRFTELVSNTTPEEKGNLRELLKEGLPNVRRYCAPLQAIFWLLEKDEYLLRPNPLRYPLKTIIQYAWGVFTDEKRWGNFKLVTDRLNSPTLINYYEQMNFTYQSHGECSGNERGIFSLKVGCCSDYTAFSVYCLRRAGYNAYAIKVVSPTGKLYHVVCEYKDKDGMEYIMDVDCHSCTGGRGILEKKEYLKKLPQIGYGYR